MYCLQELARQLTVELAPFVDECHAELRRLSAVGFVDVNVRKDAFLTLAHLIAYETTATNDDDHDGSFKRHFDEFVSRAARVVELELNRELVMSVLDALKVLIVRTAPRLSLLDASASASLSKCANLVVATLEGRIYCQTINKMDKIDSGMELDEAEYDFVLKQYASDLVPALALVSTTTTTTSTSIFTQIFEYCLSLVDDKHSTANEKTFAVGLVGQTFDNLAYGGRRRDHDDLSSSGWCSAWAQRLFGRFYPFLTSSSSPNLLRVNTVYIIFFFFS